MPYPLVKSATDGINILLIDLQQNITVIRVADVIR